MISAAGMITGNDRDHRVADLQRIRTQVPCARQSPAREVSCRLLRVSLLQGRRASPTVSQAIRSSHDVPGFGLTRQTVRSGRPDSVLRPAESGTQ